MQPAAAATTDLKIDFDVALPGPGMYQAGHRFQGPDGLIFEVIAQNKLLPRTGCSRIVAQPRTSRPYMIGIIWFIPPSIHFNALNI